MAFPILINLQSQSQDTKKVHFGSLKIQTCPGVTSSVTLFTANQVFPLHPITYDTVINLASGRITREIHFSFYKWQNKEWYDTCWLSEKIWYDWSRYIIKRVSCCRFFEQHCQLGPILSIKSYVNSGNSISDPVIISWDLWGLVL